MELHKERESCEAHDLKGFSDHLKALSWSIQKVTSNEYQFVFSSEYQELKGMLNRILNKWDFKEELSKEEKKAQFQGSKEELIEFFGKYSLMIDVLWVYGDLFLIEKKFKEAFYCFNRAFEIVRSQMPRSFTYRKHVLPWDYETNRVFLGILFGRAQVLQEIDGQAAVEAYRDLLVYDPTDFQGARIKLSSLYFKLSQPKEALALSMEFPADDEIAVIMGMILALYQVGKFKEAQKRIYQEAFFLKHMLQELIAPVKRTEKEREKLEKKYEQIGDPIIGLFDERLIFNEWEVVEYNDEQGQYWRNTPGALEFLQEHVNKALQERELVH